MRRESDHGGRQYNTHRLTATTHEKSRISRGRTCAFLVDSGIFHRGISTHVKGERRFGPRDTTRHEIWIAAGRRPRCQSRHSSTLREFAHFQSPASACLRWSDCRSLCAPNGFPESRRRRRSPPSRYRRNLRRTMSARIAVSRATSPSTPSSTRRRTPVFPSCPEWWPAARPATAPGVHTQTRKRRRKVTTRSRRQPRS